MQIILKRRRSENRSENIYIWLLKGKSRGKDKLEDLDWHIDIAINKIDN